MAQRVRCHRRKSEKWMRSISYIIICTIGKLNHEVTLVPQCKIYFYLSHKHSHIIYTFTEAILRLKAVHLLKCDAYWNQQQRLRHSHNNFKPVLPSNIKINGLSKLKEQCWFHDGCHWCIIVLVVFGTMEEPLASCVVVHLQQVIILNESWYVNLVWRRGVLIECSGVYLLYIYIYIYI